MQLFSKLTNCRKGVNSNFWWLSPSSTINKKKTTATFIFNNSDNNDNDNDNDNENGNENINDNDNNNDINYTAPFLQDSKAMLILMNIKN